MGEKIGNYGWKPIKRKAENVFGLMEITQLFFI